MLSDTLPNQVDIRKLVAKGSRITAVVPVSLLQRFVDLLPEPSGTVDIDLQFYLDEQRFRRVDGTLKAKVNTVCERCLESMPLEIDCEFALGVVWSHDDAKSLPTNLEPLIVGEELVDLADVVSEELILSFPFISYHDPRDCPKPVGYSSVDPNIEAQQQQCVDDGDTERENPFKILEKLKPGAGSQEVNQEVNIDKQ